MPPPSWLSKTMSNIVTYLLQEAEIQKPKGRKKAFFFSRWKQYWIIVQWPFAKSGCQFLLVTWLVSRKLQSTSSTSVKLCKLFYLYIGVKYISNIFSSLDRLFYRKKIKKGKNMYMYVSLMHFISIIWYVKPIDTLGFVSCLSLTHFWGDDVRVIFFVSVHEDYSLLCNDLESIS